MFALGPASRARLHGVHPRLVVCVTHAIQTTRQDFAVTDGLRSIERQRELVKLGASQTLKSKHLRQADGYGHAVDLVPWLDGAPRWEWALIYPIAEAMQEAAARANLGLRWGGVWDRRLSQLDKGAEALKDEVAGYVSRHPGPDFLDGPHFEIAE